MEHDCSLVLLTWTAPPALILTGLYWPFFTRLEVDKITTFMIVAAFVATGCLLRNRFWSDADSVDAASLPLLFSSVVQAYNTALFYAMLTKRLVLPVYLAPGLASAASVVIATLVILSGVALGAFGIWFGGGVDSLGLILTCACSLVMLQCLPSLYLCMADGLPLRREIRWLDYERILLFWLSNIIIVFGLVCIDHAIAIAEYHAARTPGPAVKRFPSLEKLVFARVPNPAQTNQSVYFLRGLAEAVKTVSEQSQSMYVGSAMFQGALRVDLLLLYYFCRVIDDTVDEAPRRENAELAVRQCSKALKRRFTCETSTPAPWIKVTGDKTSQSPPSSLLHAIHLLPASRLAIGPLLGLLQGFRTDLGFCAQDHDFPITTEEDLETYAYNVASVVAVSIVRLIFSHHPERHHFARPESRRRRERIVKAAEKMGQALQYVNIARDVERDAAIGRVYLPITWLIEEELKPADVIASPQDPGVTRLRRRILDKAHDMYDASVGFIDELPPEVRPPIRALVESYMAIGDAVIRGPRTDGVEKLKLSTWRRLTVVWLAMCAVKKKPRTTAAKEEHPETRLTSEREAFEPNAILST